ncbi:hypothetical protein IC235_08695 [Hymenobacter sp. BT664]|uniref:Uncharacterized protein n=1 Tax=Hymenobacter montanus TaxID=2771359 RepID=A0A927BD85_9BACT|nr:hypothetical protein [Hymenobacter montanus]MBD2767969.1 hypothetical protein [Hymenobacter montanus]
MLKTGHLLSIIHILVFALCNNAETGALNAYRIAENNSHQNYSGIWRYEFSSKENELLNISFQLNLIQDKDIIKGQYCAVSRGGRRIDCDIDKNYNIYGKIINNVAYIDFTGFYDAKAKGKAILYLDNGNLFWEIVSVKGEIYAPVKAVLKSDNNAKNSPE